MNIEMIPLTIDMYDGDVQVYDNSITLDQYVLVRVIAKAPHWSETVDGDLRLRRKHVRAIKAAIKPVLDRYHSMFELDQAPENVLKQVPQLIKELAAAMESVMIPGELEFETIELIGDWPAYSTPDTDLIEQFHKGNALRLAQTMAANGPQ